MKKTAAVLAGAMLILLTGCGHTGETGAASSAPASSEGTLRQDVLTVEFAPNGADPASLMTAAGRISQKLKDALSASGVEVGEVRVSMGASQAATAQAVAEGGVEMAFLPDALTLAEFGGSAVALFSQAYDTPSCTSDNPADWNGPDHATQWTGTLSAGRRLLICAGPSDYGKNLAARVNGGAAPSWDELNHAKWGLIGGNTDGILALWLADHYEGNTCSDLDNTAYYDGYDEALRALAAGEVDIIPLAADLRIDYADLWDMDNSRTGESGGSGLGRTQPIWDEVNVIGITEPLYAATVAAAPGSPWAEEPYASALKAALDALAADSDLQALSAADRFARFDTGAMDAVRRMATLVDS